MAFDIDKLISQCYEKKLLPSIVIRELCEKVKELLIEESNVRQIKTPVTVVGDVHG
jgi:serine/threonine-protein phosphatase PPG1